jgi:hypothetical protein
MAVGFPTHWSFDQLLLDPIFRFGNWKSGLESSSTEGAILVACVRMRYALSNYVIIYIS